ncbi:MAG: hypothetical protein NT016_04260 [Candidatus Aenigmarchaeota archaeon]|nr:hypothetical protein [Candidatus Aenigmarchaeota archaeon]
MPGRKGQMFLIAAVVIVAVLVVLGFSMSSPASVEQENVMKSTLESEIFDNVLNEFNATMDMSANAPGNITANIVDFAGFARTEMSGRAMSLDTLFVGTVANQTLKALRVTTFNSLGSPINASLEVNGQTGSNSSVANNDFWATTFDMKPGDTYLMNVTYNIPGGAATKYTIQITTKKKQDTYTGFFYVALAGASASHVSQYQKYITLS